MITQVEFHNFPVFTQIEIFQVKPKSIRSEQITARKPGNWSSPRKKNHDEPQVFYRYTQIPHSLYLFIHNA